MITSLTQLKMPRDIKRLESCPCPYGCGATVVIKHDVRAREQENVKRLTGLSCFVQEHNCKLGRSRMFVMEALHVDLDAFREALGGSIEPKQLSKLSILCIAALEKLHRLNYLHRDVKPHNMMLRSRDSGQNAVHKDGSPVIGPLVLIDFELMKRFQFVDGHVDRKTGLRPVGTPRYMDVWTHAGVSQSRRSDAMALLFSLLHLGLGSLPWQGNPVARTEDGKIDHRVMLRLKKAFIKEPADVKHGRTVSILKELLLECYGFSFEQSPPYREWIRCLSSLP